MGFDCHNFWSAWNHHVVATAFGGGQLGKCTSYVPNGAPKLLGSPAPFSNKMRTGGSASYAASAAVYVEYCVKRSGSSCTPVIPVAAAKMAGASARTPAGTWGTRRAT